MQEKQGLSQPDRLRDGQAMNAKLPSDSHIALAFLM